MCHMAECLFCGIASGVVKAPVVYENDRLVAFLDHRPVFPGHCLIIPRMHYEVLSDLPPELVEPLFSTVQCLTTAVERAMQADGTLVAVNNRVSQSVPHLHVHVVPRRKKDGLRGFFWPRTKYDDADQIESVRFAIGQQIVNLID